jgi:hypothetical protein
MGQTLTTAALLCTINAVLGWYLGYQAVGAYVGFWLLAALAVLTASSVTRRAFPPAGQADTIIRIAVLSFAVIVLCGLALGSSGRLALTPYLVLEAALLGSSMFLESRRRPAPAPRQYLVPLPVVGVTAAMLAFVAGFAMTHSPLTLYDSLSYHLFFAARWLQDQRLSIIQTPFSDVAQAYAPGNGELFFLWLMLPFHGDLLARIGQLPFCLLGGVTLYALARRLGAKPEHAIYAPAFYLLSRPIVEQAVGADVDLVCAATFLTSIYLGIIAVDTDERRDWVLWGISLGLYWGSKYVSLVYTPVLLLLPLIRGPRPKALWALPGILLFAMPWYLRNWMIAGSPIYPASLTVAGIAIAHGAFSRDAMLNTIFHTNDFRLFPVMAAHAVGPTLFLFWLPFACLGAASVVVRRRWWPDGYVLLVPVLMVPLYWFGIPANVDSRFLLPAAGVAMVPFAFAFRTSERWNACVHGVYALGMLWILVGMHAVIPMKVPWFMGGWLALDGLVGPRFVTWYLALAAAVALAWFLGLRRVRWAVSALVAICGTAAVVLAAGSDRWCRPSQCDVLDTTSPYIRSGLLAGWRWVAENTAHATFAYTGINLPYPLSGDRLTNRVYYVNIDRHLDWRFHDYDRAQRRRRGSLPPSPALATSSGELMPVSQHAGPHEDAVRPRYERMEGHPQAWVHNLQALAVDHLFVSVLSAYEIDYVWHNPQGFPIEDEWARADPRAFRLVYENPQVRIYAVDLR